LAWGLLFFLQKGAPIMRGKNSYNEIPMKYYDAAIKTRDPDKATKIAWDGVDMEQFAKDFTKFWNNNTLIKKAIRFDPLKNKKSKSN